MIIEINLRIPSQYEDLEVIKQVIGKSEVDAYSLDENCKIVKGKGKIKNNGSWNYHNNYDDSKDVLVFNNKQQWFTLSEIRIKEVYEENSKIITEKLNKILEELK